MLRRILRRWLARRDRYDLDLLAAIARRRGAFGSDLCRDLEVGVWRRARLYGRLADFEAQGYLDGFTTEGPGGPRRHYRLTAAGEHHMRSLALSMVHVSITKLKER